MSEVDPLSSSMRTL